MQCDVKRACSFLLADRTDWTDQTDQTSQMNPMIKNKSEKGRKEKGYGRKKDR